jgi:hypothetical protein
MLYVSRHSTPDASLLAPGGDGELNMPPLRLQSFTPLKLGRWREAVAVGLRRLGACLKADGGYKSPEDKEGLSDRMFHDPCTGQLFSGCSINTVSHRDGDPHRIVREV